MKTIDNIDNNVHISMIIDNMKPFEFRIQKCQDFSVHTLPLTKNNEQYLLIKQIDKQYNNSIHYYIVKDIQVVGRFDIGYDLSMAGITYHITDEFQNKGIGTTVLNFVVDDLFETYKVERIVILPINDRSRHIALKSGFSKRTEKCYELKVSEYLKSKLKQSDLDER